MIFIVWGLVMCLIIFSWHISHNATNYLSSKMEEAKYNADLKQAVEVRGMLLSDRTYISIGRRQTFVGLVSITVLLCMFLTKPFMYFEANTFAFIINGLIITSLIGYMVEGFIMWQESLKTSSEDEGEHEICIE